MLMLVLLAQMEGVFGGGSSTAPRPHKPSYVALPDVTSTTSTSTSVAPTSVGVYTGRMVSTGTFAATNTTAAPEAIIVGDKATEAIGGQCRQHLWGVSIDCRFWLTIPKTRPAGNGTLLPAGILLDRDTGELSTCRMDRAPEPPYLSEAWRKANCSRVVPVDMPTEATEAARCVTVPGAPDLCTAQP